MSSQVLQADLERYFRQFKRSIREISQLQTQLDTMPKLGCYIRNIGTDPVPYAITHGREGELPFPAMLGVGHHVSGTKLMAINGDRYVLVAGDAQFHFCHAACLEANLRYAEPVVDAESAAKNMAYASYGQHAENYLREAEAGRRLLKKFSEEFGLSFADDLSLEEAWEMVKDHGLQYAAKETTDPEGITLAALAHADGLAK